jgi:predicted nucleotidyltransferase
MTFPAFTLGKLVVGAVGCRGQLIDALAGRGNNLIMRLGNHEVAVIRDEVQRLDPAAETYLYGSRVDAAARGGDIDLLVVSDQIRFRDLLRLRCAILDRIGWQQLDLVVRRRDELGDPLAAAGRAAGVKL